MALPVGLKQFFGEILVWIADSSGTPVNPLAESDDTLRASAIGSTDGGTTFKNFKVETTGEQDVVMHGKDSGGNIDPFLTNAAKELIVDITGATPVARKVLGQQATSASTDTVLYTVPASIETEVTMLSVANRGSSELTFRIGLSVGGGALADADYIAYDIPLPAKNAYVHAAPIYLATTDEIRVFASTGDATFAATGLEYTR